MSLTYNSSVTDDPGFLGPSMGEICGRTSGFIVFMTLVNELLYKSNKICCAYERVTAMNIPDEEYDFVVIGGGAGGAAVAGKLSEISDWKVLVLEGGGDEPPGAEVPSFYLSLIGTRIDWNYTTVNESNACLSTNGSCRWTAGKMLGGSSAHNAMKYVRGNPTDYNNWAAQGNEEWNWEEVKKFFMKAEDNGEIDRVGTTHHATGGALPVERFPYQPPIVEDILKAAKEAGFGVSDDLNGDQFTGFALGQTTSRNGVRKSSAAAYLRPARNRTNLHVSLHSVGSRLIIENKRVVGVEFYKNDELYTVRVRKEVILSAGTMRSPQILLLSGIGPKEHLESMGIDVVLDLPGVGENLHDQSGHTLTFTNNDTNAYETNWRTVAEYLAFQSGPLASTGLSQVMALLASNSTSPDFPDVQLYFTGYLADCAPGEYDAPRSTAQRTIGIRVVYLHPKSRGRITLASTDPLEYPVIWVNYLNEANDVEGLLSGIDMALAVTETDALQAHNFTLFNHPLAACSDHTYLSKEYWTCAIRQNGSPENHQVGTCKMGPSCDPMAVVDPRLRVHGIKGLRVADASIMPNVISGNTASPSMMIGERAADFIKKDHGRKTDAEKLLKT